ncbi:MAG: tetratricopeptide repeat protein [Anaeromyxobacteraceae bacterium]
MNPMKRTILLAAAFLAAACATAGGAGGGSGGAASRYKQADNVPPRANQLADEIESSYYGNGATTQARGDEAARSGNLDQARAEWNQAAGIYASFADKFPSSDWALKIRYDAAFLFFQSRQYESAATQFIKVYNDPNAQPVTKAMSGKMLAITWQAAANAAQKAGKIEPMRFTFSDQRAGKPPEPRVPPAEWKRFIDAVDLFLPVSDADPELKKPAAERQGSPPPYFAEVSGEVSFANDNMLDAQKRFAMVLDRWPEEAEYVQKASQLYLQTFLILGDTAGHEAAIQKLRGVVQGQLARKDVTEDHRKIYGKILQDLENANSAKLFGAAQKLLEEGKFAEAGQAFETLAADPKGGDAPNALHNAAIAYDKAGQKEKAVAIRQRILKEFPDSKTAPMNQIQLALRATEAKKYDEAVKYYQEFLQKWPGDRNRCVALQNIASTYDTAKKKADAAQAYLAFGTDGECAKLDPNTLAKVLFRSGALAEQVKDKAKAKQAFTACAALQGVTDVVAKSQQDEAKNRLKALK